MPGAQALAHSHLVLYWLATRPESHVLHSDWPLTSCQSFFPVHFWQSADPAGEYTPHFSPEHVKLFWLFLLVMSHTLHALELIWPVSFWCLPAVHFVQWAFKNCPVLLV